MNRRDLLRQASLSPLALSAFSFSAAATDKDKPKRRLLVYTRSQTFEHSCVKLGKNGEPSLVDTLLTNLGKKHNWEVTCTKDGRVFVPEELAKFDAFLFETTGNLEAEGGDKQPPMPKGGKEALLKAIESGKGFVGCHCASDTFHSKGPQWENQPADKIDPYIAMLGGEFIRHGAQQKATMIVTDPKFPGVNGRMDFELLEEWYSLKNFARDLHVIFVQKTEGMKNFDYERPNFPATWARRHGKGRVFYTSLGHRDDVWKNPIMLDLIAGALTWAFGDVEADLTPNMDKVAPMADVLPKKKT